MPVSFRKGILALSLCTVIAGAAVYTAIGIITCKGGGETIRPATYPNRHHFTAAIFWFELLADKQELFEALGDPHTGQGAAIRRIMDVVNTYDALLFSSYPLLFALLFVLLHLLIKKTKNRIVPGIPFLIACLLICALMPAADYLENVQLLKLTKYAVAGEVDDGVISALMIWTRVKWGAIFTACALLGLFYHRYFSGSRLPRFSFIIIYGCTALLGGVSLVFYSTRFLVEISSYILGAGWLMSTVHAGVIARSVVKQAYEND